MNGYGVRPGHGFAVLLGAMPTVAHAHGVPVWMFVAALSPLLVLPVIAILGWLSRSWRGALVHTLLLAAWVTVFWLASNVSQTRLLGLNTDHVIWAALAAYVLHALLIVGLVVRHAVARLAEKKAMR